MFKQTNKLALALVALFLSACGTVPTGLNADLGRAMPASGFEDLSKGATPLPIQLAFNDTYGERIEINRARAKASKTNTDKGLFRLLASARKSIDGAFYDIEDLDVAQAMIAAKDRGVAIRLVTDTDNMVEKSDATKPRQAIERLKAAGIPVVDDQRSGIMHHKFMVVDGQTVWTGSTNLTPTSLYCHNNNAMTIQSPEMARAYTGEFENLFIKREFGRSLRADIAPVAPITLGNANVQVFFSPAGGGRAAVVKELAAAKRRIQFMTFSLTDVETGNTIMNRAQAGVSVEGIFDRWLAAGKYSLFNQFKAAKFEVYKDGNEALMHHKVILIDNSTVITGSYNYSQNAEMNNNEAFMIIHNAPSMAAAFNREYNRLVYAAKHNHPPAAKKPDDSEKKTGDEQ